VLFDDDVLEHGLAFDDIQGLLHDGVDVQVRHLRILGPGEFQQPLDDILAAGGLLDDLLEVAVAGAVLGRVFQQQVAVDEDGAEGVVDLVRHAGRQLSQRRQLL
jgi:hypothetical protein